MDKQIIGIQRRKIFILNGKVVGLSRSNEKLKSKVKVLQKKLDTISDIVNADVD